MKESRYPELRKRSSRILLALLLCFACIPAQSLAFAKQAWAASSAYAWAVYYKQQGEEGYTLVIQKRMSPYSEYGDYVDEIEIKTDDDTGGWPKNGFSKWSLAADMADRESTYKKEKKLGAEVIRVAVRDNIAAPKSICSWFAGMSKCKSFDLRNLDLSSTLSASNLFRNCSSLESLDLTYNPMPKLRSAEEMFKGCSSLKTLSGISAGDLYDLVSIEKVDLSTNPSYRYRLNRSCIAGMFQGCTSLEEVDLSNLKTNPAGIANFREVFSECPSLRSVDISHLHINKELAFYDRAFENCTSLVKVNMPSGISNNKYGLAPTAKSAFSGCSALKAVDLSGIGNGVTTDANLFKNCTALEQVALFNGTRNQYDAALFADCSSLKQISSEQDVASLLPSNLFTDIPGATGKWVKEGDSYVPEVIQNDIMPSWISNIPDVVYTGSPIEPAFRVVDNGVELVCDKDYAVEYKNNVKPGTATVVVSGRGKYTGSATKTFTIVSNSTANQGGSSSDSNQPNNPNSTGSNQNSAKPSTKAPADSDVTISSGTTDDSGAVAGSRPKIEIVIDGVTLREGIDFTVTYRNADKVGIATAIIKGTGKYSWTKTVSFAVKPKGTTFKKVTLSKKKTTISWKKQASQTSGYQIRYATKKSMKGAKTLKIANAKKTSTKLPRLKTGKSLYAQIRTYAVVNGKTYYSSWSAVQRFSNPPATTLSKVKATKKGFKTTWKKQSKAWTSGYQVRWSTAKSMKGAKKATLKNAKRTSLKVSKLKGGKKYYVQVRTFKKVGKKTYYSPWSKAKAVKTKK